MQAFRSRRRPKLSTHLHRLLLPGGPRRTRQATAEVRYPPLTAYFREPPISSVNLSRSKGACSSMQQSDLSAQASRMHEVTRRTGMTVSGVALTAVTDRTGIRPTTRLRRGSARCLDSPPVNRQVLTEPGIQCVTEPCRKSSFEVCCANIQRDISSILMAKANCSRVIRLKEHPQRALHLSCRPTNIRIGRS